MDQFKGQPRLPKFAVPKRYDINLKPDLVEHRFLGSVAVNLDIVAATSFIVLNAAELFVATDAVSFTIGDSSTVLSIIFSWHLVINIYFSRTFKIHKYSASLCGVLLLIQNQWMLSVQVIKPSRVELFENDEILVLEFPQEIPVGLGVLTIRFEGILNDRMKGFYRR